MAAAAAAGAMLASAVLKVATQKIGSAIGGQLMLRWSLTRDLEEMKDTMASIEAVLQDAERRSVRDAAVRLWLKRLKDAAYDISDLLDELEATNTSHLLKITMARRLKKMQNKLKKITEQHQSFGFTVVMEQRVPDRRETSSKMEEALIVGRNEDRQKTLALLAENIMQEIIILPIYGIGGIGKTTLAKSVFNHNHFREYSQVWVYVSQLFDLKRIGNSIISQVSKRESQLTDLEMIHNCLGELIAGRKILIILDDLWENDQFELDKLKLMLKVGSGSKVTVIVTTRDEGIAKKFCTVTPYKLEPLTDELCWTIIKQNSAFEDRDDKEQLEDVGREIAIKCGGVALAAQSLGYMLQSRKFDAWVSVKNSDIWNESISGETPSPHHNVLSSLKLSYSSMHPYLRLCFAYCAIFPKGHKIVKEDLIHQWISLGFIEPSNIFSNRQVSEHYISQLLGMSFLQHSELPMTAGMHEKDGTLFSMHDLVHDVARSVMVEEILYANEKSNNGASNCRYALLMECTKPLKFFANLPSRIRVLHILDCAQIALRGVSFSSAKCLRALDLSRCSIQSLPDSVGQLKQLRYLNAPGVQDIKIPNSITNLSKLSYLNLHGSSKISALPESIGNIEGMVHLDLSGCLGIEKLPESFRELRNLVHLNLSNCDSVTGVSESLGNLTNLQYLNLSYCQNIGELPITLGGLKELRYLNLSFSSYLEGWPAADVLGTLNKLEYLNLSSEFSGLGKLPEALGSFTELEYLNLSGCRRIKVLPKSIGKLKKLVHLDLSHCYDVEGIPEALGSLTMLRYLNLSHCCRYGNRLHLQGPSEITCRRYRKRLHLIWLPEVLGDLSELRYLNLSNCLDDIIGYQIADQSNNFIECISTLSNLEHLDLSLNFTLRSLPESIGALRKLHTLDLSGSYNLERLPKSIGQIDSLKFLTVTNCRILDKSTLPRFSYSSILLPHFVVHPGGSESSSNLAQLQDLNPTDELQISKLENVKSTEETKKINLVEKRRIVDLKFDWTRNARRFVEDKEVLRELVPPSTLKQFALQGYSSASFPAWVMGIAPYLPNLLKIEMEDLPNCRILPPLGQLQNLQRLVFRKMDSIVKIDGGLCGGARAFPRMLEFSLCDMESLEEWNTMYSIGKDDKKEFMFPKLQRLEIRECPKLRLKPCPPRAVDWQIWSCDSVLSSWTDPDSAAVDEDEIS
uniref:NB-ARC domain-containing protein n=1 Tax=Oryza nivara TaxID=4536 RepID=A0A0E0IZJ7_ORYNI